MLPVGVHAAAVGVVLARRVLVAGRDRHPQAAVLGEREHLRAAFARKRRRAVARTVVDDEYVRARQLTMELLEHVGQARLLVQGGQKDDGVCGPAHARSSAANCAASAATIFSRSTRASSSERVLSGERNSAGRRSTSVPRRCLRRGRRRRRAARAAPARRPPAPRPRGRRPQPPRRRRRRDPGGAAG